MEVTGHIGLYGWRVRTDIPLPGRPLADLADPDVVVTLAPPRSVPETPPEGDPVAELVEHGRRWYSVTDRGDDRVLRFHGAGDVVVSADGRDVRCHPDPAIGTGVASILVAGTVMAFLHADRGHCVLHASAVDVDGGALAVVGPSGSGKSTIAAVLCAGGARLVTDDVLVVDPARATCLAGATSLRLRTGAHRVVDDFDRRPSEVPTADGRLAIAPTATEHTELPLHAAVLPYPVPAGADLRVTRLGSTDAAIALAGAPRIPGWLADAPRRRFFEQAVALAAVVPVYAVDVPWGDPGSDGLLERLLEATSPPPARVGVASRG